VVLGDQLVRHDTAIVAQDLAHDSTVVILPANAPAATGIEEVVDDQTVVVLILDVFAIHDPTTRGLLALEENTRGSHRLPSGERGKKLTADRDLELTGPMVRSRVALVKQHVAFSPAGSEIILAVSVSKELPKQTCCGCDLTIRSYS
jgi:hypothetical protein